MVQICLRLKTIHTDCMLLTSFIIGYGDDELDGHGRWEDGGGRGGDSRDGDGRHWWE